MTASIESSPRGGQFIDRFLAFFAGAAIAVWFLGGLSYSSELPQLVSEPEARVVAELTSESTTVLTRLGEELIFQVADSFRPGEDSAPFATIGADGQVQVLSVDGLLDPTESVQSSSPASDDTDLNRGAVLAARKNQSSAKKVVFQDPGPEQRSSSTVKAMAQTVQSLPDTCAQADTEALNGSSCPRAGPRPASSYVA